MVTTTVGKIKKTALRVSPVRSLDISNPSRRMDHVGLGGGLLPCKSQYGQLADRVLKQES